MMPRPHGSRPYAQVRMQARLGRRPVESDVQRLRAASDLAACLQHVRGSPWSRHAERLATGMGPHEIERRLRAEWRATVADVTRWLPRPWQPAVLWLEWLPWLAGLQKLARGGRASGWMREDPVLACIVSAGTGAGLPSMPPPSGMQPLVTAVATRGDVTSAWLEHWRRLFAGERAARRGLDSIVTAVQSCTDALAVAATQSATDDALDALQRALVRAFRRHPLAPVAAVAYLGLEALDLWQLRGAVVRRAAFAAEAA